MGRTPGKGESPDVAAGQSVGFVPEKSVVPARAFGPGAEIGRLVRLGAIRPATRDEVDEFHARGVTGDPLIDRYNPRLATGSGSPAPPASEPSTAEAVSMPVAKDDKGHPTQSAAQAAQAKK